MHEYLSKKISLQVPVSSAGAEDWIEVEVSLDITANPSDEDAWLECAQVDGRPIGPSSTEFSYAEGWVEDHLGEILMEIRANRADAKVDHAMSVMPPCDTEN